MTRKAGWIGCGIVLAAFLIYPLLPISQGRAREWVFVSTDALAFANLAERGYLPFGTLVEGQDLPRLAVGTDPHLRAIAQAGAFRVERVRVTRQGGFRLVECWLADGRFKSYRFGADESRLLYGDEPASKRVPKR